MAGTPSAEWVGAAIQLPSFITGEGEPYRPVAMIWVEVASGAIVGSEVLRPGEVFADAARLFRQATQAPHFGPPRVPGRLRVDSEELAAALRGRIGDVELSVAPTPEADIVAQAMREGMRRAASDDGDDDGDDGPISYLIDGITPDDAAAYLAAAARFWKAAPWDVLPSDEFLSISCEALGIARGAISVVGQLGESYGFTLLHSESDAAAYVDALPDDPAAPPEWLPRHVMFLFSERAETPPPIIREVAAHGWQLAHADAYPLASVLDTDLIGRPLTRGELHGLTAVLEAIASFVTEAPALADAWDTGEPCTWRQEVATPGGPIVVELAAPLYMQRDSAERELDELDATHARVDAYLDVLATTRALDDDSLRWADMLSHMAADHMGALVHELSPDELDELLFEIVPEKVSCQPDDAPAIVSTMRALLAREAALGAPRARSLLASLPDDAAQQLARLLADPQNFGMAKSIVMAGMQAGFDMRTPGEIDAYLAATGGRLPQPHAPAPPRRGKASAKARSTARKTKRKATKQSRKRSRR